MQGQSDANATGEPTPSLAELEPPRRDPATRTAGPGRVQFGSSGMLDRLRRSYVARRLMLVPPQLIGITLVVFLLVRLIPGDPAFLFAGPTATAEQIEQKRVDLGLDQPVYVQYERYMVNLLHGDLGGSLVTSQPVRTDIVDRFPATFELISFALLLCFLVFLPMAALASRRPRGITARISRIYTLTAGSLPDFWWGLILILVFFVNLGVSPAPLGRLSIGLEPPDRITGLLTVDSLLQGNWAAFSDALGHLVLPGITLAFVYGGPILKQMQAGLANVANAPFLAYARLCGLKRSTIFRYALRNAALPAITMTGLTYAYLLGAAVVVETVFAWGGLGQYAVQAITTSDYLAISGTVLATTTFSLFVYLAMDLVYKWVDPRVEY